MNSGVWSIESVMILLSCLISTSTQFPSGLGLDGVREAKLSARTLGDTLRPIGCVQEEIRPLRCGLPMERESRLGPLGQQSAGFSEKGKAVQRADCAAEQTRFSMGGAF